MKKKILIGITVIVLIVIIITFSSKFQSSSEQPTVVRIGYLNIVASLPLFVAEEKGFFEDEGIKFASIPMVSSNQLVDGIVARNIDVFIESSAVPVLAIELRSPGKLKVFSTSEITSQTPFDTLLVKEDSSLQTLTDLSGKKIGVFPGSTATNLLKKHLGDNKIDVATITFVPIPPPTQLAALLEGSVDAIHAYEPTTAIALSEGGVRQLYGSVYANMISPNPQGVAVVSASFLENNPETAIKVVRALERAMSFMKEEDAEARQILIKRMKLSESAAQRCVFLYMLPHEQISKDTFQRYADMLTELGELDDHVNVEGLIYNYQ